jgi:hypothetical protein
MHAIDLLCQQGLLWGQVYMHPSRLYHLPYSFVFPRCEKWDDGVSIGEYKDGDLCSNEQFLNDNLVACGKVQIVPTSGDGWVKVVRGDAPADPNVRATIISFRPVVLRMRMPLPNVSLLALSRTLSSHVLVVCRSFHTTKILRVIDWPHHRKICTK